MDSNATELLKRSGARFSAKAPLDSLRQEIALNFAPHLASFTSPINLSDDYAAHLIESTPTLVARDFVGQIAGMLRPPGKQWFWHRTGDDALNEDSSARSYMDWRSKQLMRILSDPVTGSSRAFKEADQFLAYFGDACLSVDQSPQLDSLRIRNWHTKDVVWAVGGENRVNAVTRRETMTAGQFMGRFRQTTDKIHQKMKELAERNTDAPVEIRHDVLPLEDYDPITRKMDRKNGAYVSIWTDVGNSCVIRETPQKTMRYVVVRWSSLEGSAYGYSPVTMVALPDSRLHQQIAMTMLEAAEKAVRPPLVGQGDQINGDVRLGADEITWLNSSYDERTGEALRPLYTATQPALGIEMLVRTEQQLHRAFHLDKLRMPDTRNSKSTMEVQFLIDEYVRASVPLFGPLHDEYNVPVLQEADAVVSLSGGYSGMEPPETIQAAMTGAGFAFAWDNPLTDMLERQEAQRVSEVAQIASTVVGIEQASAQSMVLQHLNTDKMLRTTVAGVGGAKWLYDEAHVAKSRKAAAQQQQVDALMQQAPNISKLMDSTVNAAEVASTIPTQAEPGFALPMPM